MAFLTRLLFLAGPLLLLLLTALAGYAYSQIRYLSLPIPQALALFTLVLPFITGISIQGTYSLIQRSPKNEQYQLTIPLIMVIGFQLMYETIVATLAITHIIPPSALDCALKERWTALWKSGNGNALRAIQDSFDCCGFSTLQNQAFPFGSPSPCAEVYGRSQSCARTWKKAEQTNAGLLLLVAVILFIVKALSIVSLLTSSSWAQSRWGRPFKRIMDSSAGGRGEDSRAEVRRLIEEGDGGEAYRDEPSGEPTSSAPEPPNDNHGPRVQPSTLTEGGNEWRA